MSSKKQTNDNSLTSIKSLIRKRFVEFTDEAQFSVQERLNAQLSSQILMPSCPTRFIMQFNPKDSDSQNQKGNDLEYMFFTKTSRLLKVMNQQINAVIDENNNQTSRGNWLLVHGLIELFVQNGICKLAPSLPDFVIFDQRGLVICVDCKLTNGPEQQKKAAHQADSMNEIFSESFKFKSVKTIFSEESPKDTSNPYNIISLCKNDLEDVAKFAEWVSRNKLEDITISDEENQGSNKLKLFLLNLMREKFEESIDENCKAKLVKEYSKASVGEEEKPSEKNNLEDTESTATTSKSKPAKKSSKAQNEAKSMLLEKNYLVLNGPAGCGKTVLLFDKIIHTIKNPAVDKLNVTFVRTNLEKKFKEMVKNTNLDTSVFKKVDEMIKDKTKAKDKKNSLKPKLTDLTEKNDDTLEKIIFSDGVELFNIVVLVGSISQNQEICESLYERLGKSSVSFSFFYDDFFETRSSNVFYLTSMPFTLGGPKSKLFGFDKYKALEEKTAKILEVIDNIWIAVDPFQFKTIQLTDLQVWPGMTIPFDVLRLTRNYRSTKDIYELYHKFFLLSLDQLNQKIISNASDPYFCCFYKELQWANSVASRVSLDGNQHKPQSLDLSVTNLEFVSYLLNEANSSSYSVDQNACSSPVHIQKTKKGRISKDIVDLIGNFLRAFKSSNPTVGVFVRSNIIEDFESLTDNLKDSIAEAFKDHNDVKIDINYDLENDHVASKEYEYVISFINSHVRYGTPQDVTVERVENYFYLSRAQSLLSILWVPCNNHQECQITDPNNLQFKKTTTSENASF